MIRDKIPVFKTTLLSVWMLFLFASASPSSDIVLIRIDKAEAAKIPADLWVAIIPLQELDSSWIAAVPDHRLAGFSEKGVLFEILDSDTRGKAYFLVHTPRPDDGDVLKEFGWAISLDERTCLFRSEAGEARETLPSRFRIKRLSLENRPAPEIDRTRPEIPKILSPNSWISQMVARVSKADLTDRIQSLQNFQTRYASTANCESAGTFLYNYFGQLGLPCEYDPFSFSSNRHSSRNIIATIPGKTFPDQEIVVCAHYDSYSNQAATLAPGADDNGSGTAAVMEIARILSGSSFDYTLKFICFSAEEWGLYGSGHYAQTARSQGEKIVGVINMDMVAYADRLPPNLEVYVNTRSEWLAGRYIQAANTYAPLALREVLDASADWSDHSSFWDQGFSALCSIEEASDRNPYYHKTTDTLDKLNMDFAISVTKASLAAAADLAQPVTAVPRPTGLQARSQIISSLFSSVKTVYLQWDAGPAAIVGYNVYRTTTSRSGYRKVNPTAVPRASLTDKLLKTDTSYYYVVTAIDGQGRESDFSNEVRDDADNAKTN